VAGGVGVRQAGAVIGRLLVILGVLFMLACAAVFAWVALDLPPPASALDSTVAKKRFRESASGGGFVS